MTPSRGAALAGILVIALAGCGGSSNKQLSYSAFISKANSLCTAARAEFKTTGHTPSEAAKVLDKYLKKFKDVKPPDQLKPDFSRFLSVSDEQLAALKRNDARTYNRLNSRSDAIATQMGATECAKP